jgi:hypothetical protein
MQIISAMREWLLVCRGAQRGSAKREQRYPKNLARIIFCAPQSRDAWRHLRGGDKTCGRQETGITAGQATARRW